MQDWQQEADYRMQVKLDEKAHFLHGRAIINYVNHSPDTLHKVLLHLWPNAYSSKETPFAQQKVENGDTEFYFAREENRGYLDSLDIQVNGEKVTIAYRSQSAYARSLTISGENPPLP